MAKSSKIRVLFKVTSIFLFFSLFTPIIALSLMEFYLSKESNKKFISSNVDNSARDTKPLEDEISGSESAKSDRFINFAYNEKLSDEVWSRESYFVESLRGRESNLHKFNESYISDFYNLNKDDLFLKNRGDSNEVSDSFKIKVNTLPLNKNKKSILVVGDSFVAGQNFIDENRIFYKIFAEKIKELHQDDYFNVISAGRNGWGFYDYVLNASNLATQIDIDYLVIGFLPNDANNSDIGILRGEWKSKSGNSGFEYLNCINGNDLFGKLLLKSYNYFPKSSRAVILRYCDKYLSVNGVGTELGRGEGRKLFKSSLFNLRKFSEKNGFEVIFMPLNPMENSGIVRDRSVYELISEIGFEIIPSKSSDIIVKEKSKIGWVNPIDWHPSVNLSYAYGIDMYNYFVNRFNIEGKYKGEFETFRYSREFELFNYINSIKPFDLNYKFGDNEIRLDNVGLDMFATTFGYYQYLPSVENEKLRDKIYPAQSALCAKINRAHIEMAFNKSFINLYNSFTVKNNHKVNSIIVATKGYNISGEDIYNEGYLLLPGEYVSLKNQGNLIVASEKEGCAVEEEIKLPEFDISIKGS